MNKVAMSRIFYLHRTPSVSSPSDHFALNVDQLVASDHRKWNVLLHFCYKLSIVRMVSRICSNVVLLKVA